MTSKRSSAISKGNRVDSGDSKRGNKENVNCTEKMQARGRERREN